MENNTIQNLSDHNAGILILESNSSNITIRNTDGSVSGSLTFTKVSDDVLRVSNLPGWTQEGLGYTIGVAKEFLVAEIKPKDRDTATIKCIEYFEEIYT